MAHDDKQILYRQIDDILWREWDPISLCQQTILNNELKFQQAIIISGGSRQPKFEVIDLCSRMGFIC